MISEKTIKKVCDEVTIVYIRLLAAQLDDKILTKDSVIDMITKLTCAAICLEDSLDKAEVRWNDN